MGIMEGTEAYVEGGALLREARHNILFVQASSPIHNRDYAVSILEKTVVDLDRFLTTDTQR